MKKSTKTILTTTAAVAALTATGVATTTTAHADTNNNTQQANDANSQLNNLQSQLASQQATQASQDAAKLAQETATVNAQASQATQSENAAYSSAVASQQAANSAALADAQSHLYTDVQKANLEAQAKSDYQHHQDNLDQSHQTKLNDLKTNHDSQAQSLQSQISANQTDAQKAHDQAVADATSAANAKVNAASQAVSDAQATVTRDQAVLTAAQSQLDQANTKLSNAKTTLENAQKSQNQSSTSQSDNYPHMKISYDSSDQSIRFLAGTDWKDNDPADNTPVQLDAEGHLTGETAKQAAIFAANIINYLRDQVGTNHVKVSQDSVDAALEGVENYDANNSGISDGAIFTDTASEINNKYNTNAYCDQIGQKLIKSSENTLGQLKQQIFEHILNYLIDQDVSDHGHRLSILGLDDWYEPQGGIQYIGINQQGKFDNEQLWLMPLSNQTDFALDSTSSTLSVDSTALQTAVNDAQSEADTDQTAVNNATNDLNTAKSTLTTAKANLTSAKNALAHATDGIAPVAESDTIKNLKNQLAKLDADYNAAVKTENDDYAQKTNNLKTALDKKLDKIKALPTTVAELKEQLDAKLVDLQKAHEAKLAQIQKDAQDKIASLKAQLAASHQAENQPILDQIASLKASMAAQNANNAVKGANNSYFTANGSQVVLATAGHNASVNAATKGNDATTLPQTGNESSLALVALGAVATMFSFGLAKKREY